MGLPKDIISLNDWLGTLPHKHKIVIAGNHEVSFDTEKYESKLRSRVSCFLSHIFNLI